MRKELYVLVALLLAKAALMIAFILSGPIGLGPDEAQYWTWAQQIDWGYYSKPPGIAWEIWVGTTLFGNTPLGVRIVPVIVGFLLPLLIYAAARRCDITPRNALYAAMAFALAPMGILSSLFAITDGGLLLFWTLAVGYLAGVIHRNSSPSYVIVGLLVGCGALFKWPSYLLWPLIIAFWPFCRTLISPTILAGIAVSLVALVPSIYWNSTHDWATFRHVSSTVTGGHGRVDAIFAGNPLEYIGSQVAIVSPILFGLLVWSMWKGARGWRDLPAAVRFCGMITGVLFFGGLLLSLFMKIQGNWAIAAYPSAFVVLAWATSRKEGGCRLWIWGGVLLSVLLTLFTFAIPTVQSRALFPQIKVPYKVNPFRHNIGWENFPAVLEAAGYDPDVNNLISDKYQTVSELSFYGPKQKRAYFFNLSGVRKNQFSYWPGIEDSKRKRSFFVVVENVPHLYGRDIAGEYTKLLEPHFSKVNFLGMSPLFYSYGTVAKGAFIFECLDFNGVYPAETDLY